MNKILEYKGVHTTTKDAIIDIDEQKGIVTGYFSIFGNKDSDDDVMMQGAFTKTLSENLSRIKHLFQHNSNQVLAATSATGEDGLLKIYQDVKGLRFESKILQSTSYGRDALKLIASGLVDENSVGFQTIKSNNTNNGYREITEVRLFEGSSVTWGANEFAKTDGIKSLTKETLFAKMDAFTKALRNGNFENEAIFDSIDYYLTQLKSQIQDLDTTQPPVSTLPDYKSMSDVIDNFITKL